MNDYYEPRHLNVKKVIAIIILIGIVFLGITLLVAKKISAPKLLANTEEKDSTTIFYSPDQKESLELLTSFNIKQYNSDLKYLMELRSDANLDIFVSKEEVVKGRNFEEVVENDKQAYLKNFNSSSNVSDVKELNIGENPAYSYSFHYLDNTLYKAFYLQVIWMQVEDTYYIFDIEFPLDDLTLNSNIASAVISNFEIYEK